jgi:aspartyl-tRNA(Asn)/glutamyl-tRNA(Gln) amidotransferase subunit B
MTKIGLEIHCQLTKLESKLFCPCKADYRGFEPNTNICPICIGLPGSLPRLNQKALEKAIMISHTLNCEIPKKIAFYRKNYFYPDLPKNYQITQFDAYGPTSIGSKGKISIEGKNIKIRRIQLEEDPGRLIYEGSSEKTQITLVDYNRAGTPLVEIVTEPDFENPKQVRVFLNILVDLLENLGVSDPTLEGAIRADGNVSIEGGNKVEIKNVSSFHDLEKAVHFEITRQQSLADRNIPIELETRQWDDRRKITVSARSKEEEQDYRYFLEGDIPWVVLDPKHIDSLKKEMPESISSKFDKLKTEFQINPQEAEIISSNKILSESFVKIYETCVPPPDTEFYITSIPEASKHPELKRPNPNDPDVKVKFGNEISHLLINSIMALQNFQKLLDTSGFRETIALISSLKVNDMISKKDLNDILHNYEKNMLPISEIFKTINLQKISDIGTLLKTVEEVFQEEPNVVEQAKTNSKIKDYLIGKVMQKTKGKADPTLTLELIEEKLNS